jgi:hypothetical protein
VPFLPVCLIGGLTISVLQFPLVCARDGHVARWIPVSTFAWTFGVMLGVGLASLTGVDRSANRDAHALAGAIAGTVIGIATGGLLTRRRSHLGQDATSGKPG